MVHQPTSIYHKNNNNVLKLNKMKKTKQEVEETVTDTLTIWSFNTKRTKSKISEESIQLLKKIGKNKPSDLDLKKMLNLHNEYRFPLVQLMVMSQENIDIAKQLNVSSYHMITANIY